MAKPKKASSKQLLFGDEVEERIREAKKNSRPFLDLSRLELTKVPEAVFELKHLTGISLVDNRLASLSQRFAELPNLRWIALKGNPLESLPKGLHVTIDASAYRRLASTVDGKNLTVLAGPEIDDESADFLIEQLKGNNGPVGILVGKWAVTYGEEHEPPTKTVQKVIDSLGHFHGLKTLNLRGMRLSELPAGIRNLRELEHFNLIGLSFSHLPEWLDELPCLQSLEVGDNPITSPPAEVTRKGLKAMKAYWRQAADVGTDYLCEAKLIILGEPGAGKTSLSRKIEDANYKLVEGEKSTEGIDVIRHHFPVSLPVEENGTKKTLQNEFRVSIWDFGGQEIYHATHQFFLTRRSVYVLVCDDRKEDTDFSYWLQVVELLTDGSPLFILQNEKQDRKRDIQLGSLRARFSNLREALPVNLSTNRGLAEAVDVIERELEKLPHIGTPLPATWKRVRTALEKDSHDHISLEEFFKICAEAGFEKEKDKLQLSGYLHDLGICLHFQEDPVLKKTVVLKPSWGTDAVYRVLDAKEIIAARGHFTKAQLQQVWSEAKYAGMHDELLHLMMKFQLCYELSGGRGYIAPQLLSSDPPAYAWDKEGNVLVRYEYAFMPKGIITRFIVAQHRLIAGGDKVWKTGVVLERDGSQAEVIEDYSQRRITVRVNGAAFQGLLAIVDEQLQRLHDSFPRLQCERFLPCPCEECSAKANPEGFALEKLVKMAQKGREIQCHASGEMVDAAELVRDILPGALVAGDREGLKAGMGAMIAACDPPPPVVAPTPPVPEVYVSYAWTKESTDIVDPLKQALVPKGIKLIRDKDELRYKDSIRDFMRRLGRGKAVVVVISEKYLQSENCMFEMLEIVKAENLRDRIFPIIVSDANIYKATGRLGYIRHWEEQIRVLDTGIKEVRGDNLASLHDALNLYSDIRRLIDGITDTLRDLNALTVDQHLGSDFDALIQHVEEQLSL